VVIGVITATAPPSVRQPAVVEASQTFRITSDESGRYLWSLEDGRRAQGNAVVHQRVIAFSRDDMVELQVTPRLQSGALVTAGQRLAEIQSAAAANGVAALRAQREAVAAERALLAAGGRPEEVAEAARRVSVADANRAAYLPEVERLRALRTSGAVSAAEVQAAELLDEVRRVESDLARASLAVARSSARPEALAALDAKISALDARIAELDERLADTALASPVDGILEIGGGTTLLAVYDLNDAYLRFAIPEAQRSSVVVGDHVSFQTPSVPGESFEASVVEIAEVATVLTGRTVFLATALADNPTLALHAGMSGEVRVSPADRPGPLLSFWADLVRSQEG
jgi:HlyD family secretion protein